MAYYMTIDKYMSLLDSALKHRLGDVDGTMHPEDISAALTDANDVIELVLRSIDTNG
jgi:hypothetical protein